MEITGKFLKISTGRERTFSSQGKVGENGRIYYKIEKPSGKNLYFFGKERIDELYNLLKSLRAAQKKAGADVVEGLKITPKPQNNNKPATA